MNIATLGPEGTFSHEAVLKHDQKAGIILKETVWDVFEAVDAGDAEQGVVPIENSISGTVGLTMDALMEFDLNMIAEIILPIKHNLVGNCPKGDIKTLFVHPVTYEQCERFIRTHLPRANIIQTNSNADSADRLSKRKGEAGAIVPEIAIKLYGLEPIKRNIQDNKFNVTRFGLISKNNVGPTGHDRTSIAIYPQIDKPGLLYTLLGDFARQKINLTKIESRPSKGRLGDYVFFIDLQGHRADQTIIDCFNTIEKHFFLKVLGSYKREY